MSRIKITGDIHARPDILFEVLLSLTPGDILIVVGDFGAGLFWNYCNEDRFLDFIADMNITIVFIDGNHENFTILNSLPIVEWNGASVHMLRPNIVHVIRGEVLELEGKKLFMFGGGYSIDRARRTEGIGWWPEEMISAADKDNAKNNLNKHHRNVDYIITHTGPLKTINELKKNHDIKGDVPEERAYTEYFDELVRTVLYRKYYFGHFHCDADESELLPKQYVLMHAVRDIETGEVIYTRKRRYNSPDRIVYVKEEWM